ncbi:MAG: hypothetical protein AUK53_00800 [Betaproteobacteria bacterium CG2_30_59_46]|nr:MAG: hypothetical protein AUK53_00800 [Betaproteobacteria bacterium CG2_30_59_46]PIQ11799.1 MAG: hypothetical protein COW70_11730 [Hydrogenophilales bacterium CG18_big_fil_WC_8_21_14_2_50_58_12]PIX99194.1 MAG: hypothetical protein COZ23_11885 [Hydrogenophilales bacterium CG_4_10_14_3_um_filter_58_23]PJB07199.1 MAG: hypothetical protein CO125_05375 [Hydrogenophilales bacterium CG_4_9_14_3_um_filter_59_35]
MSKKLWLLPLAVGMMAMSPLVVGEEPAQKQVKQQEQQEQQEQVYGSQLMTQEERVAYRARMRGAKTPEEREKIRAEHHEQMRARAKERGVTLPDMPPAMGGGMGSGGGGMGPGGGMGGGTRGRY